MQCAGLLVENLIHSTHFIHEMKTSITFIQVKNMQTTLISFETHVPSPWYGQYHTCAQPYHPGSGSHGQLFRPFGAHQHGIAVGSKSGGKPTYQRPFTAEAHPGYLSLDTNYSLYVELSLYYLIFAHRKMFACWNRMITSAGKYLICIFLSQMNVYYVNKSIYLA